MNWRLTYGDILQQPADVLICSADVFLNLSGGVGGEILLRFGQAMQQELHQFLVTSGRKHVVRGTVVTTAPHGLPFKAVIHAVALDGFYKSSPEVIEQVVGDALERAATLGARRVALTALATGFGRLSMRDFARGIRPLLGRNFGPIEETVICVRHDADRIELALEIAPTS